MKYLNFCIIFLLISFCCYSQEDTLTFIGQLSFGSEQKVVDPYNQGSPQYNFFKDNFQISCKFYDRALQAKMVSATVAPKETYHDKYFQGTEVEIRVRVLGSVFNLTTQTRDVEIDAYSNKAKVPNQHIPAFRISLKLVNQINQINKNTFKIEKFIGISSPEELSIPMVIDYISSRLYGDSALTKNFLSTIVDLDNFYEKSFYSSFLNYDQLIKFYDLLHFIEPFVQENSFLNEEARKLNFKLLQMSDNISTKGFDQKQYLDLLSEYNYGIKVYQDYQKFYLKLNGYYKQLQAILFLRTPSQIGRFEENKLFHSNLYNNTDNIRLKFALGTSITYSMNKIYNITTLPTDTVQFQNISRLNSIISGGVVWRPFSHNIHNRDSNYLKPPPLISLPNNFSLGIFFDYYLYPNQKQINANSPFGLGFGIGCSVGDISILGKASFNTIRYPRQFFIDSFLNRNRPLGTLASTVDINNNSLFFDKTNISLGLTILYLFGNLRRKELAVFNEK